MRRRLFAPALGIVALLLAPLAGLHLYGAAKTITFILHDACFPGHGYPGLDLQIRALKGDAVIRMVRVIKLDPKTVKP